jgi:guanylate kinase
MIVGLIGASCCGKSHLLSLLRENGFISPQYVTTRESRGAGELWQTISIKKEVFDELRCANRLHFITEAYGQCYACLDFPAGAEDVAVVMRPENAEELRSVGGLVIYIKPFDNEYCERLIKVKRSNDCGVRAAELTAEPNVFELAHPDIIFVNRYGKESDKEFLKMIRERKSMNRTKPYQR